MNTGFTVDVGDLVGHTGERRPIRLSGPLEAGGDMVQVIDTVSVEGELESTPTEIIAKGLVTASVRLLCSRCLIKWDEEFRPAFRAVFAAEPDPDMYRLVGTSIDLEPLVRDEVLAAVPVNAVHVDDCRGLCATCGTDLNIEACDCAESELSSPFAGLKDLFE